MPRISYKMSSYNDEMYIEKAIAEVATYLSNSSRISDYEIIIVNDASTDATQVIAEEMAIQNNKVHVVTHEVNKGYGGAITTGIESCTLEYIFFTDGDLQFDIKDLDSLLACVPAYDAVLGYRVERKDPLMRKLNAYVWNRLNYYIYGLQIRDINCAFGHQKILKGNLIS